MYGQINRNSIDWESNLPPPLHHAPPMSLGVIFPNYLLRHFKNFASCSDPFWKIRRKFAKIIIKILEIIYEQ